jgi:ribosomal protein S18 acetylase RimI-like enzyme
VAVKPEMRKLGAATKILEKMLQKLQTLQVEKVYLEVSEKNHPAIALYQKAGFSNISYRPNYYDNGTTGALIFEIVVSNIT